MIDFNNPPQAQPATAPAAAPAPTGADPFSGLATQAIPAQQQAPFNPGPTGAPVQQQGMTVPAGSQAAAPTHVDVDEMEAGGYNPLPDGSYQFRLATISAGPTKTDPDKHMVTVTFEAVAGPEAGREHSKYYTITPVWDEKKKVKNPQTGAITLGGWNSRGIADAKEDMKLLGVQPPKMFPTDANAAAQIIGQTFQQAGVFTGMVKTRTYTPKKGPKAGKEQSFAELQIVGRGGIAVTGAGGGTNFGL